MGNNAAFTAFESTVLATHSKGVLDKELLSSFMAQQRGVDIDSGGMVGTVASDGKNVIEIVLTVFGEKVPPRPDLPKDHRTWTPDQDAANEAYHDELWGTFHRITDQFGWS